MSAPSFESPEGFWVKRYWTGAPEPMVPSAIPGRLKQGIGWPADERDAIGEGDRVAIYIHGPGVAHGIYAQGRVDEIREAEGGDLRLLLKDTDVSTTAPLSAEPWLMAQLANRRRRTIFVTPRLSTDCTLGTSCSQGTCFRCTFHESIPPVAPEELRLKISGADDYLPAYWVYAKRSAAARRKDPRLQPASDLFYSFKYGETELAPFFASTIVQRLRAEHPELDAQRDRVVLVPIPLDPAKADGDEPHRTQELAESIRRLSGAGWRLSEALQLTASYGKRKLLSEGVKPDEIRAAFSDALAVSTKRISPLPETVIIVDDVATHGMTLEVAAAKIRDAYPKSKVIAVTAGQMTTRQSFGPGAEDTPGAQARRAPAQQTGGSQADDSRSPLSASEHLQREFQDIAEHVRAYYGMGPWTEGAVRSKQKADRWTALQTVRPSRGG